MKLHILSDLHTEFAAVELPVTDADVIILAGDIACDYGLFGTRIVCNPRGYRSESSGDGFAADLAVQI